jgi:hypothetical protein
MRLSAHKGKLSNGAGTVRTRVKGILKYRAKGEVDVRDLNSDEFHSRKPER